MKTFNDSWEELRLALSDLKKEIINIIDVYLQNRILKKENFKLRRGIEDTIFFLECDKKKKVNIALSILKKAIDK
jgi:hypothetical protein